MISPEFQALFQQAATDLIYLLIMGLMGALGRLALTAHADLKAKLTTKQLQILQTLTVTAVQAVEKMSTSGQITAEKKVLQQKALDLLKNATAAAGLGNLNDDALLASIESAVQQGWHKSVAPVFGSALLSSPVNDSISKLTDQVAIIFDHLFPLDAPEEVAPGQEPIPEGTIKVRQPTP